MHRICLIYFIFKFVGLAGWLSHSYMPMLATSMRFSCTLVNEDECKMLLFNANLMKVSQPPLIICTGNQFYRMLCALLTFHSNIHRTHTQPMGV